MYRFIDFKWAIDDYKSTVMSMYDWIQYKYRIKTLMSRRNDWDINEVSFVIQSLRFFPNTALN